MLFIVAANFIASPPLERRPTGTPTTYANFCIAYMQAKSELDGFRIDRDTVINNQ